MADRETSRVNLQKLLASQRLAVLSTHSDGESYASLVAFAASDDLKDLVFATSRATRKYAKLSKNSHVALLIDNRSNREADFHEAVAATVIGHVEELKGSEKEKFLVMYLKKHPHLLDFTNAPSCALIRVKVSHYYYVSRFQNVVKIQVR